MKYSILIPTYNEARYIRALLEHLKRVSEGYETEIIVCDGGSTDNTITDAEMPGVLVLHSPVKGRAGQMNFAAGKAEGDILFFVHADCFPPLTCFASISSELSKGADAGCFRYRFDSEKPLLKLNAYFNRFGGLICRGGDQTLFIRREVFRQLNGFNEKFIIMEDYDLVRRIQQQHSFSVIPEYAVVSARKYEHNNWFKVNFANSVAMFLFLSGIASPQRIKSTYHSLIKHPKDN